MMKNIKFFLAIAAIFIGVPALGVMVIWHGRCHETIVNESLSPDQRFAAILTYKDCGASQPIATLLRFAEKGRDGANNNTSDNMLMIEGKSDVAQAWTDASTLSISVPKGAKVVYRRHEWASLKTQFVER